VILLVLRTLAVYAAAVFALLWTAGRFVLPVRGRIAVLLAAAPLLFTGSALLTGGVYAPVDITFDGPPLSAYRSDVAIGKTRNGLIIDVASQMLPWRKAVRESLANGRLPLWNRFLLGGEPLLGVAQPAIFHPGTWIGFLLPLPQAWSFDMTLRIFLGVLCAYLFFAGTGASETGALLGGLAWAFSDFLMFFVGYPVTPSVAPFPLLLLALWRLSRGGGLAAAGLMTGALVLMAIAGHPETLLFVVAGAGIYFVFLLAWAGRGRRLAPVLWSLGAGILAFGLAAIALFPLLEALPQTHHHVFRSTVFANADRSDVPIESLRRLVSNFVPYAYGKLGESQVVPRFAVPVGYVGSALFPLVAAGVFVRGRRKWPWLVLGALGLALSARLWGVTDLVARLPVFDIAVLDYFVFLAIFGAIALAVEGADRIRAGEGVTAFLAAAVASAGALILLAASRRLVLQVLGMRPDYLRLRVLVQVVPLLLGAGLVVWASRRRARLPGAVAGLLLLVVSQRVIEERDVYPTIPARAFYPPLPVLDPIPRDAPVRVAGLSWALIPNMSALYGIEDVRGYDPMLFAPLSDTFPLWCFPMPAFYNRIEDPASSFLSMLNVGYILADGPRPNLRGWPRLAEARGTALYANPRALARAFVPRRVVWTDKKELTLLIMQSIGDYASDGVAGQDRPGEPHWEDNGPADVRIDSYVADRLSLSIDATRDTLIGTSIPRWRGWKLTIDGKPAPTIPFNHAFVAFVAPAGRHRARLRYLPDGFLYGAALTSSSLLLAALLAARARRARTPPPA
jgi:hypothetical protein